MNNEMALEALERNIRHTMTGTVKNESLALVDELRSALTSPFDDKSNIVYWKDMLEQCKRNILLYERYIKLYEEELAKPKEVGL